MALFSGARGRRHCRRGLKVSSTLALGSRRSTDKYSTIPGGHIPEEGGRSWVGDRCGEYLVFVRVYLPGNSFSAGLIFVPVLLL